MIMSMDQTKFNSIVCLKSGSHPKPPNMDELPQEACVMEAVAWITGDVWSDAPICVPETIACVARSLNDSIKDDAFRTELLLPLIPKMLGLSKSPALESKRAYVAANFVLRTLMPSLMEDIGQISLAEQYRSIPEIVDSQSAARAAARAADAAAAYAAARAAACAAAADAAAPKKYHPMCEVSE
jgi:hypothetical protein